MAKRAEEGAGKKMYPIGVDGSREYLGWLARAAVWAGRSIPAFVDEAIFRHATRNGVTEPMPNRKGEPGSRQVPERPLGRQFSPGFREWLDHVAAVEGMTAVELLEQAAVDYADRVGIGPPDGAAPRHSRAATRRARKAAPAGDGPEERRVQAKPGATGRDGLREAAAILIDVAEHVDAAGSLGQPGDFAGRAMSRAIGLITGEARKIMAAADAAGTKSGTSPLG